MKGPGEQIAAQAYLLLVEHDRFGFVRRVQRIWEIQHSTAAKANNLMPEPVELQ